MGRVLHSERDFSTTFDEINRRLSALEQWSGTVMRLAGSIHGGNAVLNPGKTYTNVTAYVVVQDGGTPTISDSVTFTATYPGQYLLLGNLLVRGPSAGGQALFLTVFLDGVQPSDGPELGASFGAPAVNNELMPVPVIYSTPLAAGSHTFDIRLETGAATTYTIFSFDLYVFAIGG